MTKTVRITSSSGKIGWIVGVAAAVCLCLVALLCLGGGGAAYYFGQATAQAKETELARVAETSTAEAHNQLATGTALAAHNRRATETAQAASANATATMLAKWAASTSTAQARIEASTATAQARATRGTPTSQAPADIAQDWPLRLLDPFEADENDWATGLSSDDYGSVDRSIRSGKYRWQVDANEGRLWRVNAAGVTVADAYLAVDVLMATGDANTRYGLVMRDDGENYYYFDVGLDGRFSFYLYFGREWTTLVPQTRSAYIDREGVNRLAVLAEGEQFALYINGELVAETSDDHLSDGLTGLGVNLNGKTPRAVYEFDNYELRMP